VEDGELVRPHPAGTDDIPVALRNVFLHVTKQCNLRCRYCYFSASRPLPGELTVAEFRPLWADLVALRPRKIVFTGGEPLLRPDILELLVALRAVNGSPRVRTVLNTNGFPVTTETAHRLTGLVDEVRVSLDGAREQHDAMRGEGSFDAAVRALGRLRSAGLTPRVLVTVTPTALPGLADLLCWLVERGITAININPFRPVGRGARHPEWVVAGEAIAAEVRRAWDRCHPGRAFPENRAASPQQRHCGVGRFLNIMPNGDVFPCHVLTRPEMRLGNIRRERLGAICRRGGLLGGLAALDFAELAAADPAVEGLTRRHTCLAEVYAETSTRPVWRRELPMLPGLRHGETG